MKLNWTHFENMWFNKFKFYNSISNVNRLVMKIKEATFKIIKVNLLKTFDSLHDIRIRLVRYII